jgi:hypothetical protein
MRRDSRVARPPRSISFPYPLRADRGDAGRTDIYAGLWYPIIFASIIAVVGFFFLPETKDVDTTK